MTKELERLRAELVELQRQLAEADAVIHAKFQPFGAKPKPNSISAEHLDAALARHERRTELAKSTKP